MAFNDWEVKISSDKNNYQKIEILFYVREQHSYQGIIRKEEEVGRALLYTHDLASSADNYYLPDELRKALESIHTGDLSNGEPFDVYGPIIMTGPKRLAYIHKLEFRIPEGWQGYYKDEFEVEGSYYFKIFEILNSLGIADYVCVKAQSKAKAEKPYKGRKDDIRAELRSEAEKFKEFGGFIETFEERDPLNPYLIAKVDNLKTRYKMYDTKPPLASLSISDLERRLFQDTSFYNKHHISLTFEESILDFFGYLNTFDLPTFTVLVPTGNLGNIQIQCDDLFINNYGVLLIRQLGESDEYCVKLSLEKIDACNVSLIESDDEYDCTAQLVMKLYGDSEEHFLIIISLRTL